MRVLFLAPPSHDPEGLLAFSFLNEEAIALQESGAELYVITDRGDDRVLHGIQVRALPPGRKLDERMRTPGYLMRHRQAFPPRMSIREWAIAYHHSRIENFAARLVRNENIAVIHSHFGWPYGLGGATVAAETGRPLIATFRGMDLELYAELDGYGLRLDPLFEHCVRNLLRSADFTTYVSKYMRTLGVALGAMPTKAITIMKGVHLDRFTPAADRIALRSRLGFETPMILSVGGLEKRKGVHHILQSLAKLRMSSRFTYVVVGDGPNATELRELSKQLGLQDRVVFRGRLGRGEVSEYFSACDVFVLGSLTEASGNVVLEAMSAGRPVICTDSGGPPEYVLHERMGYVVPVGDTNSMAQRIEYLLDHPEVADSLGQAARQRMVSEFGYSRMVGEIQSLYKRVLQ